jgi:signal transduction histidine kinase/CheY-like chemotaxis protein
MAETDEAQGAIRENDDEAQRALKESEERYRAFVANSSEAIWRCELEEPTPIDLPPDEQIDLWYRYGYLAECNEAMARMYGFTSSEELAGTRIDQMLVREDPKNLEYFRAFVASGYRLIGAESHEVDREGNEKYFLNNLIGIVENGFLIRAWGTQRDVTEQRIVQRELERANRAKDEFLAMLSHELRTPMTATLGWATMMQMGTLPPDMLAIAAESIAHSTRSQARLIDDLLDISRIVAGKMQLSQRLLPVADPIAAAVETIRPAADARHIDLRIDFRDRDVRVHGDAERLQQVFWNLLSNAVKFTPRFGTVKVELTAEDDTVRVVVRDSGDGIEPELLPHIFERFRQGDGGSSRRVGGLGLGLAIASNLVELHGGTIAAASLGKGHGTEMTVLLPAASETAEVAAAEPAATQSALLKGLSLLVVEDDPGTRAMLEILMRQYGAEVVAVGAADPAFEALSSRPFDLVLSDIGLPGEDGISLLRRVRAAGHTVPAIAVTAYAGSEERARALGAGFQAWMSKPIDPHALVEEVRSAVRMYHHAHGQ